MFFVFGQKKATQNGPTFKSKGVGSIPSEQFSKVLGDHVSFARGGERRFAGRSTLLGYV